MRVSLQSLLTFQMYKRSLRVSLIPVVCDIFRCTDGTCVLVSVVCDHQPDCIDSTDETACREYIIRLILTFGGSKHRQVHDVAPET